MRERFCIDDAEVLELAGYAIRIEDHYSSAAGHPMPMDIEWAKDGDDGQLYIVQARPETVASQQDADGVRNLCPQGDGTVLATGRAVGEKIAAGAVRVIADARGSRGVSSPARFWWRVDQPDWEPVMKIAAAIVTERGGRTCHAAIVARELGVPAVVGRRRSEEGAEHRCACDGLLRRGRDRPCIRGQCCRSRSTRVRR